MSRKIGSFQSVPIKTENMPPCLLHELQSFYSRLIMQIAEAFASPIAHGTKLQMPRK